LPGPKRDDDRASGEWPRRAVEVIDTAHVGASEESAPPVVLERGRRRGCTRDLLVLVVAAEGWCPAITRSREAISRRQQAAAPRHHRPTVAARRRRRGFLPARFDPVTEVSPSMAGLGDLLDEVVQRLEKRDRIRRDESPERDEVAVTIVGAQRGKSSSSTGCCGGAMIVSEMPGTTRDAVDTLLTWHRRKFASSTRRGQEAWARGAERAVESVSVLLARRPSRPPISSCSSSMRRRAPPIRTRPSPASRQGRARLIIVANKWDLVKESRF